MDYDTFINSAFLVQGRADEFTMKPPAERKRILADILGLGQYDAWEGRAREASREQEVRRRELTTAIGEIVSSPGLLNFYRLSPLAGRLYLEAIGCAVFAAERGTHAQPLERAERLLQRNDDILDREAPP